VGRRPPGRSGIDPARQDVAAALVLFGATALSSVAFKTGALRLVFSNGWHLIVKPDPRDEAWCATGPGDLRFAFSAGGQFIIRT
jgi:Family of unknown function (DUF6188)